MIANRMILVAALSIGSFAGTGCDASKEELEKTKAQLTTVTADRDALKAQVATAQAGSATAQAQATAAQQQLADLTAKHVEHMRSHEPAGAAAAAPGAPKTVAQEVKAVKAAADVKMNKGGSSTDQ